MKTKRIKMFVVLSILLMGCAFSAKSQDSCCSDELYVYHAVTDNRFFYVIKKCGNYIFYFLTTSVNREIIDEYKTLCFPKEGIIRGSSVGRFCLNTSLSTEKYDVYDDERKKYRHFAISKDKNTLIHFYDDSDYKNIYTRVNIEDIPGKYDFLNE